MSQPTHPDAAGSEQIDLLADDVSDRADIAMRTEQTAVPWQFIQQGYDWTGGSLRTRGYRTDFDAVREIPEPSREPATALSGQAAATAVDRLDWRHPDHLGVVQEFVSSLTDSAPIADAAASNEPKTSEVRQRSAWHWIAVGLAAVCLLAVVSVFVTAWNAAEIQQQPLTVAAVSVPAEPADAPLPIDQPSTPSPEPTDTASPPVASAPTTGAPREAVVSSQPAADIRIELEAREILVSSRAVAAVIVLKRTGSAQGAVRVRWKTVPGTATPATDYESVSAIAKFADGQTVRTLFVPILQPPSRTEPRSFTIKLQRLGNSPRLGTNTTTTVTIWGDT